MKLSILIPTLPSRFAFFARLWAILEPQLTPEVEVLWLGDRRVMSVGAKRNALLALASGRYLMFCDDDDRLGDTFVADVLAAIESDADCIVYDSIVTHGGKRPKRCVYGIEYDYEETVDLWAGRPAHTMTWKSSIAKQCKFPEINFTEDTKWVAQAWPLIKTQYRIDKVLYYYDFDRRTSETRK